MHHSLLPDELPVEIGQRRCDGKHACLLSSRKKGLQDGKAHTPERGGILMTMETFIEIALSKSRFTPSQKNIKQVSCLNAVTDRHGNGLQHLPPHRILSGQRLNEAGESREKQRKERTHERFGDASSSSRTQAHLHSGMGAIIESLGVEDFRLTEQDAQGAIDKAGVHIAHIAVDKAEDVSTQLISRLPDVFALAASRLQIGKDLGREIDRGTGCTRDLASPVRRAGIHHRNLVEQRHMIVQGRLQAGYDLADGILFIQSRNAQRNGLSRTLLESNKLGKVGKLAMMESGYHAGRFKQVEGTESRLCLTIRRQPRKKPAGRGGCLQRGTQTTKMKILHTLLAAFLLAGNLAAQDTAPLKLVFWNLEWFPGGRPNATPAEAEAQIAKTVPAVAALKPDIFGMAEVRDWNAAEIAIKGLPDMSVQVSSDFVDDSGSKTTQQVVIASRLPAIGGWWEAWKTGDVITPTRGFSFAAYQPSPNHVLLVYSIHLKSNRGELKQNMAMREESARQLVDHVAAMEKAYGTLGTTTTIIGGDFNTSTDDPKFSEEQTFKILEAAGFQSAWKDVPFAQRVTLPTKPSRNPKYPPFPDACFDHILVKNANVVSASVGMPDPNPSDHRPVIVDITLPTPPTP